MPTGDGIARLVQRRNRTCLNRNPRRCRSVRSAKAMTLAVAAGIEIFAFRREPGEHVRAGTLVP